MAKVVTHMCMSLDGFVAQPDDDPAELFDWYWSGDVVVPSAQENMSFSVDEASAPMLHELTSGCGALIAGRRLFDQTDGWGDNHPAGAPVVVVTHRSPPEDAAARFPRTTFTGSVEEAIATAKRDRRRQVRHDRQRRHHPAGAEPRPRRRAVHQPGASAVRNRHPLLRRARRRTRHARGPRRGPRHPGAPPPLPRAPLTADSRTSDGHRIGQAHDVSLTLRPLRLEDEAAYRAAQVELLTDGFTFGFIRRRRDLRRAHRAPRAATSRSRPRPARRGDLARRRRSR